MHIDRWVKASVVFTFISTGFSGWMVYRTENPKEPTATTIQGSRQTVPPKPVLDPSPLRFWILLSPTVASSLFLAIALIIASRRKEVTTHIAIPPPIGAPPKLKIISAYYGVGGVKDVNVTDVVQKHGNDAMAFVVTNDELGVDPLPGQPKRLQVEYTYGSTRREVSRPEGEFIVLPADEWLLEELGAALKDASQKDAEIHRRDGVYATEVARFRVTEQSLRAELKDETQAKMDRETRLNLLQKQHDDLKKELAGTDVRSMPSNASDGDKKRRQRAIDNFAKLTVPQKFSLRLISKYQSISYSKLVRLAQEAGFGNERFGGDPSIYINYMASFCELVKADAEKTFTIDPAFIGDVEKILTAWFTRIASSSEAL